METLYIEELQIQSKITVKKMRSIDLNVLTSFGILYFSFAICSVSCDFFLYLDYKYALD